jgi:hypothetical protein
MFISLDFDGTVVTHDYPRVGKDIGAVPVLEQIIDSGHKIILFTMRGYDNYLQDAVDWFEKNNIPLYGINTNPTQHTWTTSPKALADLQIDDAGLNCPLKYDPELSKRPFVDWNIVEQLLKLKGII